MYSFFQYVDDPLNIFKTKFERRYNFESNGYFPFSMTQFNYLNVGFFSLADFMLLNKLDVKKFVFNETINFIKIHILSF